MRTTIYINTILLNNLKKVSAEVDVSKNELISMLLSRVIYSKDFDPKPYETVKYQDSYPEIIWKREHIELEPVFYEKVLDLRRNFKFSVSWFISFAILKYLNEIVIELSNPENHKKIMDNYHCNFIYISKMLGDINVFITMHGIPEDRYLEKLLL